MQDEDQRDKGLAAAQARLAALEAERDRYRLFAEVAFEGLVIHREGVIIDVNQMILDMIGHPRQTLIGVPLFEFIAPQDRDIVRHHIAAGIETPYEVTLLRADGALLPCEAQVKNVLYQGQPVRVAAVRDISNRRQMEQALRDNEARYRMLADNVTDMIWTMELDGTLTYVSPSVELLRGYSVEEVMQQSLDQMLTPESYAKAIAVLQEVLADFQSNPRLQQTRRMQLEQTCSDGSTVWTEVTASLMYNEAGEFAGILGVSRDISDRRESARRALELALQKERVLLLERLIGGVAHDLKTPLTTMNMSLAVLRRSQDADQRGQHLDILHAEVMHLQQIVDDLLVLMRLDKVADVQMEVFDLRVVLGQTLSQFSSLAAKRGHAFSLEGDMQRAIHVRGDGWRLKHAVGNLLANAISYTPPGGNVLLQVAVDTAQVTVAVIDDGIGISRADQDRIFDYFYRVDPARSTAQGGLGLGLAIAQRIIQAHGGQITVESAPGRGSTFSIILPLVTP